MSDLTDKELELALSGECHSVEVVVWLAREVKRVRDAQRPAVNAGGLHDDVRGVAIRALDRHLVGTAALGVVMRNRIAEAVAEEVMGLVCVVKSQELPEIFPFVTFMHREVVLRPKDGESQDIEMTPDEADRVAYVLRAAAGGARPGARMVEVGPQEVRAACVTGGLLRGQALDRDGVEVHRDMADARNIIQLSGNAPLEIFLLATSLGRQVVIQHKDGESQDIVLTPDEADRCADQLCAAAAGARAAKVET
jgi:hypothetical protein